MERPPVTKISESVSHRLYSFANALPFETEFSRRVLAIVAPIALAPIESRTISSMVESAILGARQI